MKFDEVVSAINTGVYIRLPKWDKYSYLGMDMNLNYFVANRYCSILFPLTEEERASDEWEWVKELK